MGLQNRFMRILKYDREKALKSVLGDILEKATGVEIEKSELGI